MKINAWNWEADTREGFLPTNVIDIEEFEATGDL